MLKEVIHSDHYKSITIYVIAKYRRAQLILNKYTGSTHRSILKNRRIEEFLKGKFH